MQNKWKRSQSPSFIPRLLRTRSVSSPCESTSLSPSPTKMMLNSKIPTATGSRRTSSYSNPNLSVYPFEEADDICKNDTVSMSLSNTTDTSKFLLGDNGNNTMVTDTSKFLFGDNGNNYEQMLDEFDFAQPLEELDTSFHSNHSDTVHSIEIKNNLANCSSNQCKDLAEEEKVYADDKTMIRNDDNAMRNSLMPQKYLVDKFDSSTCAIDKQEVLVYPPDVTGIKAEETVEKDDFSQNNAPNKKNVVSSKINETMKFSDESLCKVTYESLFKDTDESLFKLTDESLFKDTDKSIFKDTDESSFKDTFDFKNERPSTKEDDSKSIKNPAKDLKNQFDSYKNYEKPFHKNQNSSNKNIINSHSNKQNINALYITSSLITKLTKTDEWGKITELNLSLAKTWKRKIQFIENLEELYNLRSLNLSNNNIEKIQNLHSLVKLTSLNLSYNRIASLNGIQSLFNLKHLNLNHNQIATLPKWFDKKLKKLHCLNLAGNNIEVLDEMKILSSLTNLNELEVNDNPFCEAAHSEKYIIFVMRSINILNNKKISNTHREDADQRFNRTELKKLALEIIELKNHLTDMKKEREQLKNEKENWVQAETNFKDEVNQLQKQLKAKIKEADTQNLIIENKSKELSKACKKQYKLEQELTFHKLDAKFDEFWIPNQAIEEPEVNDYSQESAYIGKAVFKEKHIAQNNIFNHEQVLWFSKFLQHFNPEELQKDENIMKILGELVKVDSKNGLPPLNEKLNDLKKKNNELTVEITKLDNHNKLLMQENQSYNKDSILHGEKIKELQNLLTQTKDLNAEKVKTLEKTSNKTIELLNNKNRASQHQVLSLQKELANATEVGTNTEAMMEEIQQLKEHVDQLNISIGYQSSDRNKIYDFIKRVNQFFDRAGSLNGPETLFDKPMQAVLSNLKVFIKDFKNSTKDMKDTVHDLTAERTNMMVKIKNMEDENKNCKFSIKQFKGELDVKESNERVLKHELSKLKSSTTVAANNNDISLKEYDNICTEMKCQIESMEKRNNKLKKEVKTLRNSFERERDLHKETERQLKENMTLYDASNDEMNDKLAACCDDNEELLTKFKQANDDLCYWKEETQKIKIQAQRLLDQESLKYKEDMQKLFIELQLTKSHINQLRHDYEKELKKTTDYADSLYKAFNNIERKLKDLLKKQNHNEKFVEEISKLKIVVRSLTDEFQLMKLPLDNAYVNVLKNMDNLVEQIESKHSSDVTKKKIQDEGEKPDDVINVLLKSLEEINRSRKLLKLKEEELKLSNVPESSIKMQSQLINSLMGQLDQKEKELQSMQKNSQPTNVPCDAHVLNKGGNFASSFNPSLIGNIAYQNRYMMPPPNSTVKQVSFSQVPNSHTFNEANQSNLHTDDQANQSNLPKPSLANQSNVNAAYIHHHYFNDDDSAESNEQNLRESDLKQKEENDAENPLLEKKLLKLSQSEDELKWKLNRLESKIGDAMLRKSLSRQSARLSNGYS